MLRALIIFILSAGTNLIVIAQNGSHDKNTPPFLHRNSGIVSSDSIQVGWVRQYISGYEPAFDFAYAIDVDPSGNSIVTGSSYGADQLPDFITIKFNSSGDTLWIRRYNGPGNNWDIARSLAVDEAGSVYVTGETYSDSTFFNYLTIKYDASGNLQWASEYNGPSSNDDGASAIALDDQGNVYVTGHSWTSGTSWNYATIKYNSTGQQQWVANYNGPGNIGDFASGIAIDQSGNVYVTGTSDDLSVNFYPAYATVKYNSAGVEQWTARYRDLWSYAKAIVIDESGNIYVTGHSYAAGTLYDYATIKYNSGGVLQWAARYNGPGTADDYATSLAIDASGNVYVTGEAFFEAGHSSDYATVKYNNSGVEQWVARYDGPENSVDRANAIALDGSGNIYITGESRGTTTNDDFATIKYDSAGDQQWAIRYNGQENTFDLAAAIGVDSSLNVYVTGRSARTGGSLITTIKYMDAPVPVELVSFTAAVNINTVTLNWITASEINNSGFEILRCVRNNRQWMRIGFINGIGTTSETQNYTFIDDEISPGEYLYILKQIDYDGTFAYSNEIEVSVGAPLEFSLEQNYPNPFNPETTISYSIPAHGYASIKLYDLLGKEIKTLVGSEHMQGSYSIEFNAEDLSSGVYIYKLTAGNYSAVRKMQLIK